MHDPISNPTPLSKPARLAGSVLIAGHFVAVAAMVLAAYSGPWGGDSGPAGPPRFALRINQFAMPYYLRFLRFTHTYHFHSSDVTPETRMEIRVLDADRKPAKTLQYPAADMATATALRYTLLADRIASDESVQPYAGERIPAPNQRVRMARFWEAVEGQPARLKTIEEHLLPRDHPLFAPMETSMILARSFARYAAREHGGAVEVIRRGRAPVTPEVLNGSQSFDTEEEVVSFGVYDAVAKQQ